MTAFEAYGWTLAAIGLVALTARNRNVTMSYSVVASNWCAWSAFILATGAYEPWQFGIAVDGLAMTVLLFYPSNRIRAVLAATYCAQVAMHIAFGLLTMSRGVHNVDIYANWLGYIGWAQIALVGGHGGAGIWHRVHFNGALRYPRGAVSHSANIGTGR